LGDLQLHVCVMFHSVEYGHLEVFFCVKTPVVCFSSSENVCKRSTLRFAADLISCEHKTT